MKKILIVDDSNTAVMMEKLIFQSHPYVLLVARDGEEAVQKAVAERPDLVLMDLVMPKVDGLQALRRLREHEVTRLVPVIVVTARGEAINMELALREGANDYVVKPVNGAELLLKVRALLG